MKLIIANWKSNKNREQVERWMDEFEELELGSKIVENDCHVVIAPAMPSLMFVSNRLLNKQKHPQTSLAVQDISPFDAGSYTGAVSTVNLEGFGVRYALVGHSERRRYFGETDLDVANKVERCVEAGITPILCVDEEYLVSQFNALGEELASKCIVAYEPLSAIGSGDEMSVEKVVEVRAEVENYFGEVQFIYGGSVTGSNVSQYLEVCDGVLVGGASLEVSSFVEILK